jgi:hypothetical protein
LIRCTWHDVEVWDLENKDAPRFRNAMIAQARACAVDQNNILLNDRIFTLRQGVLLLKTTFDAHLGLDASPPELEAYPYGSVVSGGTIFIAQPDQVLILARQ